MPTNPPDDLEQRFNIIKRHLHALGLSSRDLYAISRNLMGLAKAIDDIEREMLALHQPRTEGERAAQAARSREEIFLTGPMNVKETFDYDLMQVMAKKKR